MQLLRQSTVATVYVGPVLDAAGAAVTTAVLGDFRLVKNGTAATLTGATVTHDANGYYTIALTTGNTDTTGRLDIGVGNTAMSMANHRFNVRLASVFDALVTNATNATGGLPTATGAIAGLSGTIATTTNITSATGVTLAAVTHTGAVIPTVTTTTTATNVTTVNGLAANVITATSIASNAITSAKIAADAIGATQIAANAITSAKIATDAIGAAQIAANAIGSAEIADGAITSTKFAAGAINAAAIAADAITDAKVASDVTIASVTGAVGSVTGNVGGNVVGSVGSVTGAVGSVTGNVGGNVVGSVGSISGVTFPTNFASTSIDVSGRLLLQPTQTGVTIPTVTTLTNLPSIPANWLTAAGIANGAFTNAKFATGAIRVAGDEFGNSLVLTNLATAGQIPAEFTSATFASAGVFATAALANAPSGSGPTASAIADAVWDEAIGGHLTAGSTGAALNAAGGSGDPWSTVLPGSYVAGQAGYILDQIVDKTNLITSQSTFVTVDRVNGATITMYYNEATNVTVPLDENTTSLTLRFVVENADGLDVLVIENASVTRTSTNFTVTITTAVTATLGQYKWALRDITGGINRLVEGGVLQVLTAANKDA